MFVVRPLFPPWTNKIPTVVATTLPLLLAFGAWGFGFWASPWNTDVGYQPEQPVPYSHQRHAGDLGIDCRYCHDTVERGDFAALPPTDSCMGCHAVVLADDLRLARVRDSFETDQPIAWVKVHQLPDYAYFSHRAHMAAGVACASCHGRVDRMRTTWLATPLSMGWCLGCHRDPTPQLVPRHKITDMAYDPVAAGYAPEQDAGRSRFPTPPLHCSGCHQ